MVIVLTGDNSFLLQRELRTFTDSFIAEHGDLALEKLDGDDTPYDRMREALESLPFLARKKMVVLRTPSHNKEFIEHAENLLKNVSDTTDIIIVEPKLDKRLGYYKQLKKLPTFQEFPQLDIRGLVKFVQDEAIRLDSAISGSDAQYLVERMGLNQQLLASEVKKLTLHSSSITKASIDQLTESSPQSKVFDLIDAAFSGNQSRALQLYHEQRQQKVEPQAIIGMLAWQLHILAVVTFAGDISSSEVAGQAKLSPYVVSKTQNIARRLSQSQVKGLITALSALDYASKTKTYDLDEALQNYIVTIK